MSATDTFPGPASAARPIDTASADATSSAPRIWAILSLAAAAGVIVGVLTSFGQGLLDGPFNALVNSASAWLVAPFLLGRLASTPRPAVAIGALTCLAELLGYYVTAELRGYSIGDHALVLLWVFCAVIGGPLLAFAGYIWRVNRSRAGVLAPLALSACFLVEGLRYEGPLGRHDTAALWFAIAAVIAGAVLIGALLSRRPKTA